MRDHGYRIPSFSIITAFLCLALVGVALVFLLPVKLVPSDTVPTLQVSYSMPRASAEMVESQVTARLEGMMSRVEGVKNLRSVSQEGGGTLTIELDKHVKRDDVRLEVSTLIRQLWPQLPAGVTYPVITTQMPDTDDEEEAQPFQVYTLVAPALPQAIQDYGEDYLKPVLSEIEGIYSVELTGAVPMEWQLNYDAHELEVRGVKVSEVENAVRSYLSTTYLGIFRMEREDNMFRLTTSYTDEHTPFNLADISIKTRSGLVIPLDRLVTLSHQEGIPQSYYRINGQNSIYMTLIAAKEANQLVLADKVGKAMEELRNRLPEGYSILMSHDSTEDIRKELDNILYRTGLTILLLLLFVVALTRSVRYTFLILVSLAINQAVAFILYYFTGLEIHLYSLAGITISVNLVIDNVIVMADHLRHKRNLKAFLPILAATLTTMSALCLVFFLDESLQMNLRDFALVVIINMGVSLAVALALVPALMDKLGMYNHTTQRARSWKSLRVAALLENIYSRIVHFLQRFRYVFAILWIALFAASIYVFVKKVYTGEYYNYERGEIRLHINASLPNGATIGQMNSLIGKMEDFLSHYKELKQLQTRVISGRRANITVEFKKEYLKSGFPYQLNDEVVSQALKLGGGSWAVSGIPNEGFNNSLREANGGLRLRLLGYNYAELQHWAQVAKDILLERGRISEVSINAEFSYFNNDYQEFHLWLDTERMAALGLTPTAVFQAVQPMLSRSRIVGSVYMDGNLEALRFISNQNRDMDMWGVFHTPVTAQGVTFKLADVGSMEMQDVPQKIVKENQQYQLCLQYAYQGAQNKGIEHLHEDAERLEEMMPMGYSTEISEQSILILSKQSDNPFGLLIVVAGLVFLLSAILFNSLKQPFAIILLIPVSYIGVFLTFWLLELRFDQGGFAALILLCGITVNSGIYVMNACNNIVRQHPLMSPNRVFVKACSEKITPILLTVFSTILGFIPFILGDTREPFWYSLAMGTIGGLVTSLLGVFMGLPLLRKKKK